jgi:protein involved in polysaccharide export with SLBB domain
MKWSAILFLLTCFSLRAEQGKAIPIEQRESIATVAGEVARPGPVKLVGKMGLYAAILSAGGPTTNGSLRRVTVTRKGREKVYDLTDDGQKVIQAKPGDTITVAKKNFLGR